MTFLLQAKTQARPFYCPNSGQAVSALHLQLPVTPSPASHTQYPHLVDGTQEVPRPANGVNFYHVL